MDMTSQEIQERNKQIALMLNIKIEQCYPENKDHKQHGIVYTLEKEFAENVNSVFLSVSELKFHKDWRWLMEAVEFIERLSVHHMVETNRSSCVIYNGRNIITANYFKADKTKKEAVFIAVSDFAKLYNDKQ
jgi:hypothetical protein